MNIYQHEWRKGSCVRLYDGFRRFIEPAEREYLKVLASEVRRHFRALGKTRIRILDIGAGAGHSTIPLLLNLSRDFAVEYSCLDVSRAQLSLFRKAMKRAGLSRLLKKIWLSSWEDFHVRSRYGLILSYHSWYGITGWKSKRDNTILKIKRHLTKAGLGIIVANSRHSITSSVAPTAASPQDITAAMEGLGIFFLKQPLAFRGLSKSTFLSGKSIKKSARPFFAYLFRMPFDRIPEPQRKALARALSEKQDGRFFQIPCHMIEIFR